MRVRSGGGSCQSVARLLAYREAASWQGISSPEINAYVREQTGGEFSAKDFRTLHGTIAAAVSLAKHGPEQTKSQRAKALDGLPVLGQSLRTVHLTQVSMRSTCSRGDVVRHTVPLSDVDITEMDGILVTAASRTAVDLAEAESTVAAVVVIDALFQVDRSGRIPPKSTIGQLREVWKRRLPLRAHARPHGQSLSTRRRRIP